MFALIIVFVLSLVLPVFAQTENVIRAKNPVGWIVKFEGQVKVKRQNIFKSFKVTENNFELFVGDCIRTKRNSRAFIRFIDDNKVVLDEKSILFIEGYKQISPQKGRVYFKIRKGVKGVKIRVSNILIGVKGTEFAVDLTQEGTSVFVNEGKIELENISGEFKRYLQKEQNDFEKFMQKQKKDFEKYKEKIAKEFFEFVKSFELESGAAVSIVNNEVKEIAIPEEIKEGFKLLEFY